jgi:uncharacterized RDD family membrane protein YckC
MSAPIGFPANVQYVGFWARTGAALIDSVLLLMIIAPLLYWFYGPEYFAAPEGVAGPADLLLNWVFPALAVIAFWIYRQATPGKMVIGARIVDARTGQPPSTGQLIGRYFGYYVSMIPLCLGLLWVAFDARKQGWHDKLAGTVVIRGRR